MKYIDAEKLKAEIERRNLSNYYTTTEGYEEKLYEIIDSLQQEQPEEELTEFEIRLLDWLSNDTSGEIPIERMKEVARNRAAELRSLVREEFENEAPSIIEVQSFREGFKVGKAEALRDLPRWKTWGNGACGSSSGLPIAIVKASVSGGYLLVPSLGIGGEQYIMLSDLEKLPKEG